MKINAGCSLTYHTTQPALAIFMLRPRSGEGQWITHEQFEITPVTRISEYVDRFGNLCQRTILPQGDVTLATSVTAFTDDSIDTACGHPPTPVEHLPFDTLVYLLPSRYCPSDLMGDIALSVTQGYQPGYDQAEAIRAHIQKHITYQYGSSDASTTALDTWQTKQGVCRDFSHLGISLCRALSLPARIVAGYLYELEPMDLHAWYEVFIDGRWYTFDPTQKSPKGNRIVIAYGRDAADVAFGTQFAPVTLNSMNVWVNAG